MGFWVTVFLQNLSQNAKNAVLENTAEIQNFAASKCMHRITLGFLVLVCVEFMFGSV